MENTHRQAVDGLAAGVPLAEAQQRLEVDGYLLVADLCDPEFVAHLLEVSLRRGDHVISALGTQSIGIGSAAALTRSCSALQGAGTSRSHRVNSELMNATCLGGR